MSLPLTQLVLSTNHPKAELLFFSCVPVRITSPSYSFSYLSTLVSQRTDSVQVNVAEVSSFTIYHSTLSCHHSFHVYRQSRECLSDSLNSLFSYITEQFVSVLSRPGSIYSEIWYTNQSVEHRKKTGELNRRQGNRDKRPTSRFGVSRVMCFVVRVADSVR